MRWLVHSQGSKKSKKKKKKNLFKKACHQYSVFSLQLFMQIDALYPKRFGTWSEYAKKYCNAHYRCVAGFRTPLGLFII